VIVSNNYHLYIGLFHTCRIGVYVIDEELRLLIKSSLLLVVTSRAKVTAKLAKPIILDAIVRAGRGDLLDGPNGPGPFKCSKNWINVLLRELNLGRRRVTSAAQNLPLDFELQGLTMARRLAYLVFLYDVHASCIVNMDQTGLHVTPASSYTRAFSGSKSVSIIGSAEKKQITLVPAVSMAGDVLPFQVCIL
jgi:hypothetical protein